MFRAMRRTRQELSRAETQSILENGITGVLAVHGDDGYPYTIPINYVYKNGKIYFHCAQAGHKYDAMLRCEKVSFCVIAQDDVIPDELSTHYKSAIAFGRARLLEGAETAQAAYDLGLKYNPDPVRVQAEVDKSLARVACFEITIDHLTGKQAKGLLPKT